MKKLGTFIFWIRFILAIIGILFEAISFLQIFISFNAFDILSKPKLFEVVNVMVIILLIWWIAEKEWNDYQNKSLRPILRVKNYGSEEKPIYKTVALMNGMGGVGNIKIDYDTLFIVVFNAQKHRDAKRVWSNVEWMDFEGHIILSHQGRWHIANPQNVPKPEDLQYVDLDSNGHPEKLHFASINKTENNNYIYGLAREDISKESWDNPKYKIPIGTYVVKITLSGNNDVKQIFKYRVSVIQGKLNMLPEEMMAIDKIPKGEDEE